jgi:hypothetical protein
METNPFNIDELQETTFDLGKITFKIEKLNALKGFKLFDKIRAEIGANVSSTFNPSNAVELVTDFIRMLLSTPSDFILNIQPEFYPGIIFRREGDTGFQKLNIHNQDSAFFNFDTCDFYEFLARCFVVNFFSSFQKIQAIYKRHQEAKDKKEREEKEREEKEREEKERGTKPAKLS